jgi:hypothetical protein
MWFGYMFSRLVIAGFVPAIHRGASEIYQDNFTRVAAWITGTSPVMTVNRM